MQRFLVVEDNAAVARSLSRRMEKWGAVTVATSLADARTAMDSPTRWAGMTVDLALPDGSGIQLIEEIRARGWKRPVMVVTGTLEPDFINRVAALDIKFAAKPIPPILVDRFVAESLMPDSGMERALAMAVEHFTTAYKLSKRERRVLEMATEGLPRGELARRLGRGENTVRAQIRALLKKTQGRTLPVLGTRLLQWAFQWHCDNERAKAARPAPALAFAPGSFGQGARHDAEQNV